MAEKSLTVLIRGDMLRSWLLVTGWTQSRLAETLGVSKGRVSQLFSASEVYPSAQLIAKLLRVTGMPFERLFRIGAEPIARQRTRNGHSAGSHDPANGAAKPARQRPVTMPVASSGKAAA